MELNILAERRKSGRDKYDKRGEGSLVIFKIRIP
jgi:hypothetical protein